MNCPQCQESVEPTAAFCGNCGFKLHDLHQAFDAESVSRTVKTPDDSANVTSKPSQTIPAYALPKPSPAGNGSVKVAMIIAILAIPAALIPILGLGLSITAIVLSVKYRQVGRKVMIVRTIGVIAVVLSLAAWIYNVQTSL